MILLEKKECKWHVEYAGILMLSSLEFYDRYLNFSSLEF